MKKTAIIGLAAALSVPCRLVSQDNQNWNSAMELLAGSADEGINPEQTVLYFEELRDNPLNINRASPWQLLSMPFLSENDVEEISAYLYLHGPLLSLGELQLIPGLDYEKRQLLKQFVYIGPGPDENQKIRLSNVLKYGKMEVIQGADIPLYAREGYKKHSADVLRRYPNREYLGNRVGHNLRLSFSWNSRIRLGITSQKDAGEPFFEKRPAGYDFYAPYLYVQNAGRLNTVVLGRYRISAGCGLLLGSGFSMGSGADAAKRSGTVVRPHSSSSETGYFTGAAVQFGKKTEFTAFVSSQMTDAVLAENGNISSFKTDGYHRTPLEFSRKHNCRQNTLGIAAQYEKQGMALGLTSVLDHFSRKLPDGGHFSGGLSADFAIRRPSFAVWGETAADLDSRSVASLYNLTLRLPQRYELTLSTRYYGQHYESLHSCAMAQSEVSDEYGFLASIKRENGRVNVCCFIDAFGHPGASYWSDKPTHGIQFKTTTDCRGVFNGRLNVTLNYKAVQKDCKETDRLEYMHTARLKLTHKLENTGGWSAQSQWMLCYSTFPGKKQSWGKALNGNIGYSKESSDGKNFDFYVSGCLFSTGSYDSSVSIYENGPRYGFGFMTLSGQGLRTSAMVKIGLPCKLQLTVKIGSTVYRDRDSTGSGAAKLDQNHKEDLGIQAIWKFCAANFLF